CIMKFICSEADVGDNQRDRETVFCRQMLHDRMFHWWITSIRQYPLVPALDPTATNQRADNDGRTQHDEHVEADADG
ncbi:Sidestep-like protein, partial [Daphnia magna]